MATDFSMYSGETKNINITINEQDGVTPVDLTGATITWHLKGSLRSGNILVSKDNNNGIIITDTANGKIRVQLSPADTSGLNGIYYHVCEITDLIGDHSVVLIGKITVSVV